MLILKNRENCAAVKNGLPVLMGQCLILRCTIKLTPTPWYKVGGGVDGTLPSSYFFHVVRCFEKTLPHADTLRCVLQHVVNIL